MCETPSWRFESQLLPCYTPQAFILVEWPPHQRCTVVVSRLLIFLYLWKKKHISLIWQMGKCIICWFGKDEYFLFNLLVMDFIDFFGIFGSVKIVYFGQCYWEILMGKSKNIVWEHCKFCKNLRYLDHLWNYWEICFVN